MKSTSLLEKTSPLEIFLHFLDDLDESLIRKKGNPGRNISSPFQKDDNPSCSVYEDGVYISRKVYQIIIEKYTT